MADIINGKALAKKVRGELKSQVEEMKNKGIQPGLAVVLVGEDPASAIYVRGKTKMCQKLGMALFDHHLPATTTQEELLGLIDDLNKNREVDGILVQLPLPPQIDKDVIIRAIDPTKDVDGFHPVNLGNLLVGNPFFTPCTPQGIMRMLQESETQLLGAEAVVVGRSIIVGKPMSLLLLSKHCTVTMCHSRTRDLPKVVSRADIVVACVGQSELIKGHWIKPGATVIDVGMNRNDDKLTGDVDFAEASKHARAITPVPGGVGPMTIAMLMQNTVLAASRRKN